jgi:hypothetical protein
MNRLKIVVIIALITIAGCSEAPPLERWHVSLVSPSGITVIEKDVLSHGRPCVRSGPHSSCMIDPYTKQEISLGVDKPPGWIFVVKKGE